MPRVEYRWTLGNVLALVGMCIQVIILVGGGLWYASKLEARIEENASLAQESREQIARLDREQQAMTARLQTSETNYGRMDERLIAMQAILLKIDRQIERISP